MPIVEMPIPKKNPTIEELAQIMAQISETLGWILEGKLDSRNAREFGGWKVGLDKLQSKDGKVGMSTSEDGEDPIRYWAGDLLTGEPDYYVTKSGKMVCNNAAIRGIIEALGGVIGGFVIEANRLYSADGTGLIEGGKVKGAVVEGGEIIGSKVTTTENVEIGTDLSLGSLFSGERTIKLKELARVYTQGDSIGLTAMANIILSCGGTIDMGGGKLGQTGTVYVATTAGGPTNTPITFTRGVRTT